jgi:GNAT superfamily N-acetyltransferase
VTLVRRADVDDADGIGRVHVSAALAAYRGVMPDAYLDAMDARARSERWRRALAAGGALGVAKSDHGEAVILVAEDDQNDIVGIAAVGIDRAGEGPTIGELRMINVDPASWASGVATVLLHASERELRGLGFDQAVLWVLEQNIRARRFYEREGWTPDGGVKIERRPGFTLRQVRYRCDLVAAPEPAASP